MHCTLATVRHGVPPGTTYARTVGQVSNACAVKRANPARTAVGTTFVQQILVKKAGRGIIVAKVKEDLIDSTLFVYLRNHITHHLQTRKL